MAKDETKGTPGTNPDGTPKDDSKGTPKDKGKLYTVAQIDKLKSDAAAMGQGRAEKVAEQEKGALTQELQTYKSRLDALEAQERESRLAEARGDSDKMRAFQREEAVSKRERQVEETLRDITKREGQIKADRAEIDKDRGVVSVAYVAAKHGLEPEDLEDLGITDPEQLEKVAVKLAAAKPKGEGEDADREAYQALETDAEKEAFLEAHPDFDKEAAEKLELDTGETAGGAGAIATLEKANEDFQAGKITEKQLQEAASKVPDKVK